MLEQVLAAVRAAHFEVIRARLLGLAFHLIPAVQDLAHLNELFLPPEPARGPVGPGPGVAFDLG